MTINYKIFFNYILLNHKFIFIKNDNNFINNYKLIIFNTSLIYLILHLKLSSLFFSSSLRDLFAYELPTNYKTDNLFNYKFVNYMLVYNFLIIQQNIRIYIFVKYKKKNKNKLYSITDLFISANWLEREVMELSGIQFSGKKDIRNLMLQYGDNSNPLQKIFPTVGIKEFYYNSIIDSIYVSSITLQL